MIVVLDTNQLYNDHTLQRAVRLSNELRSRGDKLVLPLVVLDELSFQFESAINSNIPNGHIEEANKSIKKLNVAIKAFQPFLSYQEKIPLLTAISFNSNASVDRKRMIQDLIDKHEIEVHPYPDLEPLISRGRKYLKPFYKSTRGKKEVEIGYRDAALWQSVINIAIENGTEKIIFISGNTNDFADKCKGSKSLHPDLLKELASLSIQDQVEYLIDIKEFVDREFSNEIISFGSLEEAKTIYSKVFENFKEMILGALQDYPQMPSLDLQGITEENEIIEIVDFVDVSTEKKWEKGGSNISLLKFSIELEVKVKVVGFTSIEGFDSEENQFDSFTIIDTNTFTYEPFVRVEFKSDLGINVEIIYSESEGAKYSVLKVVPLKPSFGVIRQR